MQHGGHLVHAGPTIVAALNGGYVGTPSAPLFGDRGAQHAQCGDTDGRGEVRCTTLIGELRILALVQGSGITDDWNGVHALSREQRTRVRELSVSMALPAPLATRLGANRAAFTFAARNLGARIGRQGDGLPTARRQAVASAHVSF